MNTLTFLRRKEWQGKISETEPARLTRHKWRALNCTGQLLLRNVDFNKWNKANLGHTTVESIVSISGTGKISEYLWWKLEVNCIFTQYKTDSLSLILKSRPDIAEAIEPCVMLSKPPLIGFNGALFHVTTGQEYAKNVSIKAAKCAETNSLISARWRNLRKLRAQERFHKQLKGEADF